MIFPVGLAVFPNHTNQLVVIPFVYNHEICPTEGRTRVEAFQFVSNRLQARVDRMEFANRFLAVLSDEALIAP